MSDPQHDIRTWLQSELAKRGHGAKGALAEFLGVRPDAITRITNTNPKKETREIRAHELVKMREFFAQVGEDDEESRGTVPLVGYVGAGAEVHFYGEADGKIKPVPGPKNGAKDTLALQVEGKSMGPYYATWLLWFDRVRGPVTQDMISRDMGGPLCIVGLSDRVLVRKIQRSKAPGFFHLLGDDPILDVEIAWAARVTDMQPR